MVNPSNLHGRPQIKGIRTRRSLLQIASDVSSAIGVQFFQSMVQKLCEVLGADCVYLGEFVGGQVEKVRILAAQLSGSNTRTIDFPLAGSAVMEVALGRPYYCRKGVRVKFPADEILADLHAEALIAVPLLHPSSGALGVLAAIYARPIHGLRTAASMLEIFAPRAGAELNRKQADELLRESEQRHLAFISSNPDGMWRVEFESPIPIDLPENEQVALIHRHGYVAECNDSLARLAGRTKAAEVVGSRISDLLELDSDETMRAGTLALVRAGYKLTTVEIHPLGRDGTRRYMLRSQWGIVENRLLERIWGTSRDMTELRKSELALDASEQRMADLLEAMHLAVVMLDPIGRITFCNDHLLRITGWSSAEVRGKNWFEMMIPADEQEVMRTTFDSVSNGVSGPAHIESALRGRDGRRRWIAWDCSLLADAVGGTTAVVNIGRDVTEYRELEAQFRQAQKLESIGRLASGVAHDFNNLLTVIIGYSEALLASPGLAETASTAAQEIRKAASKGADLAHQLLAFSSRRPIRPSMLDLNTLVKDSERMLRRLIGDDIELITRLDPVLGIIRADPGSIHQVLLNLAVNARDAMPHGGRLTIFSSNVIINGTMTHHVNVAPGRYIELAVSDTGTGMTSDVRDHLFEPFFTTKPPGRGTGLGLSTVYGIVQQNGGHISVDTELNRGSTFSMLFPRVDEAPDGPDATVKYDLKGGKEKILIVEDQPEVRILAAKILREFGYDVREAEDSVGALEFVLKEHVSFDLVLTDVVMPTIGGIELAERIRIAQPDIKVILMSGYADRSVFENKLEAGHLPYIQKPFRREELAATVRQVLDRG